MAEWAALHTDILVLIAKRVEFLEDFCSFYAVCKSWHSVTSILGTCQSLPSRYPWIMLTDKAEINFPVITEPMIPGKMLMEQVGKNEQIEEGMHNRQFFSLAASKTYEFELPEATLRKCLGVGYGLLLTVGYDLQINILNPFTRQQIGMPNMLSFKIQYNYNENLRPQQDIQSFVGKVAMSSNPFKPPSNGEDSDCIIMAIYGEFQVLAFARPGDQVWTDVSLPQRTCFLDVVYYNGRFYAVNRVGIVYVCDFNNDANEAKATPIACLPGGDAYLLGYFKYLVELSGDLLLVVRLRKGNAYNENEVIDEPYNYTVGFLIFKLEPSSYKYYYTFGFFSSIFKWDGGHGHNYPYKLTKVKNLGNNALFIGNNASVSVPCSAYVRGNSIYFSDNEGCANLLQPYGSGYDTGFYDVKSGKTTLHSYASKFMSHLTPLTWIVS